MSTAVTKGTTLGVFIEFAETTDQVPHFDSLHHLLCWVFLLPEDYFGKSYYYP